MCDDTITQPYGYTYNIKMSKPEIGDASDAIQRFLPSTEECIEN